MWHITVLLYRVVDYTVKQLFQNQQSDRKISFSYTQKKCVIMCGYAHLNCCKSSFENHPILPEFQLSQVGSLDCFTIFKAISKKYLQEFSVGKNDNTKSLVNVLTVIIGSLCYLIRSQRTNSTVYNTIPLYDNGMFLGSEIILSIFLTYYLFLQ